MVNVVETRHLWIDGYEAIYYKVVYCIDYKYEHVEFYLRYEIIHPGDLSGHL